MQRVGLKVLKNSLSTYVRRAAAGETVQITDRDRVVAELVPPRPHRDGEENPVMAQLIREGLVSPAKTPPHVRMPERLPPIMTFEEMMRDLDDSRSDR